MARMMTNGKSLTKEELISKIDEYFNEKKVLKETKESIIFAPKTKVGLAVYLGISMQTLSDWEKDKDFGEIVAHAKQRCEMDIVNHSLIGTYTPSVSMFLLKNQHGYVDKQEVVSDNVQKIEIIRSEVK
ncbi:DNA-packaging protein [Campylobacter molothri]|uniref:DNA-packaging protein n=1 Tax=Campylobacter molothri TaxID=1032242 RepID=UPI001EFC03B3|nr:DNA-packaging protein [Campylobacter sp. RM10537]ULO00175.1 phage terminase, small subunit [Campylobacter sp. RM10537]